MMNGERNAFAKGPFRWLPHRSDNMTNQSAVRVYEYVDVDGTVYWSFTKHPSVVSPPIRLVLQDRKGTMIGQFLVKLRQQGFALLQSFNKSSSNAMGEDGDFND